MDSSGTRTIEPGRALIKVPTNGIGAPEIGAEISEFVVFTAADATFVSATDEDEQAATVALVVLAV